MLPKKPRPDLREAPALPFDVTQEIDPALVEQALDARETTLTQVDFDDITLVLPEKRSA
jgi:hypothetical protein